VGKFDGLKGHRAWYFADILHFCRVQDLAQVLDGKTIETSSSALGIRIHLRDFARSRRCAGFRRSEGLHRHFETVVKKTSCGCWGRVQMGWYDRKIGQVRDLCCGDMRIIALAGGAAHRLP
jgi:hypothetical protein